MNKKIKFLQDQYNSKINKLNKIINTVLVTALKFVWPF